MFFSLDRPVTKSQILNTQFHQTQKRRITFDVSIWGLATVFPMKRAKESMNQRRQRKICHVIKVLFMAFFESQNLANFLGTQPFVSIT